MTVRESIMKQIMNHLREPHFLIPTPKAFIGTFPNGADTVCKAMI